MVEVGAGGRGCTVVGTSGEVVGAEHDHAAGGEDLLGPRVDGPGEGAQGGGVPGHTWPPLNAATQRGSAWIIDSPSWPDGKVTPPPPLAKKGQSFATVRLMRMFNGTKPVKSCVGITAAERTGSVALIVAIALAVSSGLPSGPTGPFCPSCPVGPV